MQLKRLDHHLLRKLFKRWFASQYIKQMESGSCVESELDLSFTSSPIIVLGMHRSGTSLLIKTLTKMGVFSSDLTGPDTSESLFFQYINDAILCCCQSHWTLPEPIEQSSLNPVWCSAIHSVVARALRSRWRYLYRFFSPDACLLRDEVIWAWKDPRNTLTVKFWRALFPNARFVYIYRHGIDVAESLVQRECKRGQSVYNSRCLSRLESFHMWESYNRLAMNELDFVAKANQLHLCFEDMVSNPISELYRVADFCGLSLSDQALSELSSEVDSEKAFAYKKAEKKTEWQALQSSILDSEILARLGYH